MSVNNEAKTTKLVTQWNISAINYSSGSTAFEGSYMEDWLNDTSADGFLGNLRDYESFLVTDSVWDATMDSTSLGSITRPNGEATVTATVGLLNMYEYQTSYYGTTYSKGYLNNGLYWWTLTPYDDSQIRYINNLGASNFSVPSYAYGIRPSINLKANIKIVEGNGTVDNPYRLNGDNDADLSGTLLSSRYSGEYIRFGSGENNLYRIVSHETSGLTKITSAEPLKDSGIFKTLAFGNNVNYSDTNTTIGSFLNGDDYLINYVNSPYIDMIEENTIWYLGTVGSGESYKLSKYINTNMTDYATITYAKVGLLRNGELMASQIEKYNNNIEYWTLTPYSSDYIRRININGNAGNRDDSTVAYGIKPALNLKSNVVITSGDGTLQNPFEIELG